MLDQQWAHVPLEELDLLGVPNALARLRRVQASAQSRAKKLTRDGHKPVNQSIL
jgi:hypothetical protein